MRYVSSLCCWRRQIPKQTPPAVWMCGVGNIAYKDHLPSAASGPGRNQTLHKLPLDLKWHFGSPIVLLMGCCGGQDPESTVQTIALWEKVSHYVLGPVWLSVIYLHPPPLLPSLWNNLSVVSHTLHLYFGALGSSFLMSVTSLVLCVFCT